VFHPGLAGGPFPAFLRLLRGDLDDRAGDRGAQRGRAQPAGAVQDQALGSAGFFGGQKRGGTGDECGLLFGHDAVQERGPRAGELDLQVMG
jgi:hypothetical protein